MCVCISIYIGLFFLKPNAHIFSELSAMSSLLCAAPNLTYISVMCAISLPLLSREQYFNSSCGLIFPERF